MLHISQIDRWDEGVEVGVEVKVKVRLKVKVKVKVGGGNASFGCRGRAKSLFTRCLSSVR